MRPQNALDWIAFVILLIGTLAWGIFVTDVNVFEELEEYTFDALDDIIYILILLSGLYWLWRVVAGTRRRT